jgi:hypothetical protein
MGLCQWCLAVALLNAPPGSIALADPPAWHAEVGGRVRLLALDWQLLDSRELSYLLADPHEFAKDLKTLQERRRELRNAPLLEECARFPPPRLIEQLIAVNRGFHVELDDRLALDRIHAEELRAALDDTEQLFRIWDTLRDAVSNHYCVNYRRQALDRLRDLLGPQAFYRGDMPPSLPIWRFPRN